MYHAKPSGPELFFRPELLSAGIVDSYPWALKQKGRVATWGFGATRLAGASDIVRHMHII